MNILQLDPIAGLNDAQRVAVETTEGPVLVLAGAGSGKTRVLVHRVAHIINQGLAKPWQILAMTFTNKAANELKERVHQMVPGGDAVAAGTFHSTFLRLLKRETEALGYPKDFSVFDSADSDRLIRMIMKEIGEENIKPKSVKTAISRLKNELVTPAQAQEVAQSDYDKLVAKVYAEYEKRLVNHAAMDFDDLLVRPLRLFRQHPMILNNWSSRWKYIHVDEYQDTNMAQFELVKLLAGPHPNLFVVGDDDQSIYSWRGARVENIFQFRNAFPGAKVFRLEQNYRSTQAILDLAHAVVARSSKREEKRLWTEKKGGMKPVVIEVATDTDEAATVADKIKLAISSNKRSYSDIAILYRTNGQSRLFEDVLRSKRIPYQVIGALAFYERKEVKDAISYFKLCMNPRDEVALRRIIAEPPRGIGDRTLETLIDWAREHDESITKAMEISDMLEGLSTRGANVCKKFAAQIENWRKLLETEPISKWAQRVLEESGYLARLQAEKFVGETRMENIEALISSMAEFEQNGGTTLAEYLEQAALATDLDKYNPDEDSVRLMTVHAAKGLEFPLVFVTGLEDKMFPLEIEWSDSPKDTDEERRLFYVAVTRSMEELVLTHAAQRRKWGQPVLASASKFLKEIPDGACERESTISSSFQGSLFGTSAFRNEVKYSDRNSASRSNTTVTRTRVTRERQAVPAPRRQPQAPPEEIPAIHAGELVMHETLGKGIVLSMQRFKGDIKVVVEFEGGDERTLLQSRARLRPVKD